MQKKTTKQKKIILQESLIEKDIDKLASAKELVVTGSFKYKILYICLRFYCEFFFQKKGGKQN